MATSSFLCAPSDVSLADAGEAFLVIGPCHVPQDSHELSLLPCGRFRETSHQKPESSPPTNMPTFTVTGANGFIAAHSTHSPAHPAARPYSILCVHAPRSSRALTRGQLTRNSRAHVTRVS